MEDTIWTNYVGAKIISATPMDEVEFLRVVKGEDVENRETRPGYCVTYPPIGDEHPYQSWSPKDVFENAYRELTEGETRMVKG